MKFPKSVHAEGWQNHFDAPSPTGPRRVSLDEAWVAMDDDVPAPAAQRRYGPWLVGGVAVAALGLVGAGMLAPMSAGPESVMHTATGPLAAAEPAPSQASDAVPAAPEPGSPAELVAQAVAQKAPLAEQPAAKPQPTTESKSDAAPAPKPDPAAPAPKTDAKRLAQADTTAVQTRTPPLPERRAEAPLVKTLPATPDAAPVPAPAPVAEPSPPVVAAAPVVVGPDDGGITAQVRTALASDEQLALAPIEVSTHEGVVKLEGQVPDAQLRARATVVAAATQGVRGVDNRLTLPAVSAMAKPALQGS